ncbi:MAG: AAA family ATPase [Planctomycetota bacterium]|nr:AAA family ATPase [Xanthomonadales bacterium]MDZ4821127.1 AAA family ATPase [Planctomycetota bacterium]
MFKNITIHGWRQFRRVDIDFHPRLTVLTGANGAGKTTLLNLVSRHFGWSNSFISTPTNRGPNSTLSYSTDYWQFDEDKESPSEQRVVVSVGPQQPIGTISYSNDAIATLSVSTGNTGSAYDVQVANQQAVEGLHIPSHRPTYSYQQVQSIPTVPRRRNDAFQQYLQLIKTRYGGGHTQWSPQYYMKETLIALATFGYGNAAVEADVESARIFEDFQDVLRRMLPPKLGFRRLIVRVPEVILDTATGPFSIDAVSGGAAAVIDLAWQVFMYQPGGTSFVVTLDEPENHLHPELQRRVLADLITAFPTVQFVVATHSPFIVGSVPQSNIYVLDYDETNKVNSTMLDTVNKAGSANEILRDVLGLEFTMPVWVEAELSTLLEKYSAMDFTNDNMTALRTEMAALGLAKHATQTIARLAGRKSAQ